MINAHIGCHLNGKNLGLIGTQFLSDDSSKCTSGKSECFVLGKRACDGGLFGDNCWGFAVHTGGGVQIYDSRAANTNACSGKYGLMNNAYWTTFKKV